jgi:hypothetical protein
MVKTLSRDIYVFHYTRWIEKNALTSLSADQYGRDLQAKTWEGAEIKSEFGLGYYAASDPVSSENYGTSVVITRLKRGTPFLDLDVRILGFDDPNESALILSHDLAEDLTQMKLGPVDSNYVFSKFTRVEFKDLIAREESRRALHLALRQMNVEVIRYNWGQIEAPGVCHQKSRNAGLAPEKNYLRIRGSAFFFVDYEFKRSDIQLHRYDGSQDGELQFSKDELNRLRRIYRAAAQLTNGKNASSLPLPEARLAAQPDSKTAQWIRKHLFACTLGSDGEVFEEDLPIELLP